MVVKETTATRAAVCIVSVCASLAPGRAVFYMTATTIVRRATGSWSTKLVFLALATYCVPWAELLRVQTVEDVTNVTSVSQASPARFSIMVPDGDGAARAPLAALPCLLVSGAAGRTHSKQRSKQRDHMPVVERLSSTFVAAEVPCRAEEHGGYP